MSKGLLLCLTALFLFAWVGVGIATPPWISIAIALSNARKTASQPVLKWKYAADAPTTWSTPRVVDQKLYVTSELGSLYAIDVKDGTLVWKFRFDNVFLSRKADEILALDATDRSRINAPGISTPEISTPEISGGVVYATLAPDGVYHILRPLVHREQRSETRGEASVEAGPVSVVALNQYNGELLWQTELQPGGYSYDSELLWQTGPQSGYSSPCAVGGGVFVGRGNKPVVSDGIVYYPGQTNEWGGLSLYAVHGSNGAILWESELIFPGAVYHSIRGNDRIDIHALDGSSGRSRWTCTIPWTYRLQLLEPVEYLSEQSAALVVVGETLYVGLGTAPLIADGIVLYACPETNTIYALDATDGHLIWESGAKHKQLRYLVAGDYVCGGVYAVHTANGEQLWRYEISPRFDEMKLVSVTEAYVSLDVEDGVVYGTSRSTVFAHDVRTGDLIWEYELADPSIHSSTITVTDHTVYVAADDGYIYAIEAP